MARLAIGVADLGRDLRFGWRGWRKRPGFASAVILMLAVGIAAVTTVFALAYAELWRPLALPQADRLVSVKAHVGFIDVGLNAYEYQRFQQAPGLVAMGAATATSMTLADGQQANSVPVLRVTPGLLPVFDVTPELGRNFLPSEASVGHDGEALISDRLWHSRFGASPGVLGQTLRLDQRLYVVVGVLPASLGESLNSEATWIPMVFSPSELQGNGLGQAVGYGRLRAGITLRQAQGLLAAFSAGLGLRFRQAPVSFVERSLGDELRGSPGRGMLLALLACVGLVLLIACVNVAGLLLARSFGRQQEIAVRQALGAGRGRLVRQLLIEGMMLAAAACGAGLLLAHGSIRALRASPLDRTLERLDQARLDPGVLAFCVGLTALCALLFSLAPALRLSRPLRVAAGDSGDGVRASRWRSGFLVAEVALTLILLVGAGLMAKSLVRLATVRTGLNEARLGAIEFQFTPQQMKQPARVAAMAQRVVTELRGRPGWNALAIADDPPLGSGGFARMYKIAPAPELQVHVEHVVGPSYFATVGQPLLLGRDFDQRDTVAAPDVVIVNQAWVRAYGRQLGDATSRAGIPCGQSKPGPRATIGSDPSKSVPCQSPSRSPLGLQLRWTDRGRATAVKPAETNHTIVGVVADARDNAPDIAPGPELYLPYAQTLPSALTLVLNAADPAAAVASARRSLAQVEPDLPISVAQPVEAFAGDDIALPRFQDSAVVGFAGVALLLALSGIWALVAFSVEQRRREFGIRMALGAEPGRLLARALRQALGLTALGVAVGLAGAWAATRWIQALLFGVRAADPATFAAVTAVFVLAAVAAAYLPARRVLAVDPAETLRCD